MATLIIPTPLRKFTDNQASVKTTGKDVRSAVLSLTTAYPLLKKHIFDDLGNIRSFVRIYVDDDDYLSLQADETLVHEDTVISIIPAIAGGAPSHSITRQ